MQQDGFVAFGRVGKSYDGETMAVRDVTFSVARGEFFTMLGPSGSGKTSCLMMLAGFEDPTVGTISLAGRSLARVAPYDRNIGLVFQSYALFPHMTVAENVAFPLKVRKIARSEITERVNWILSMVRLDALADRRPTQLSGGQQQRVALARALVFRPDLVLMDEPLGALDRQLREHLQIEIRRIQQEIGATVVFVTHDQEEALSMSDRIAIFNKGRVQQADTPQAIYDRPANAFVAGFVGDSMRMQGRVTARENGMARVEVPGIGPILGRIADLKPQDTEAVIVLRPEHLSPTPDAGENRVAVQLAQTVFLGNQVRANFAHPSQTAFFTRLPAAEAAGLPAIGAEMHLSWRADRTAVFAPG